jgi:hypothetical protein
MTVNIAWWDRIFRVLFGGVVALGGLLFARGTDVFGYQALAIAAALVGLDFVITGAIGFCPLYQKLGRGTARRHGMPLEGDHHASRA